MQQMEQMAQEGVKDYLKDFDVPITAKIDSPMIQAEIERVTKSQKAQPICDKYINVDMPMSNEIDQWKESIDRAKVNFTVA